MNDLILTKNKVSVGTVEACPFLTFNEALFLTDNNHMPDNKLNEAIFVSRTIFRFPLTDDPATPKSLKEVEDRIRERRLTIVKNSIGFYAFNPENPESCSCRSCGSKGIVTIVGLRYSGVYHETLVKCGACGSKTTLNIEQAVALRNSAIAYANKQDESTKAIIIKNAMEYITPDHEFGHEWVNGPQRLHDKIVAEV